jgi:hypothetical protein
LLEVGRLLRREHVLLEELVGDRAHGGVGAIPVVAVPPVRWFVLVVVVVLAVAAAQGRAVAGVLDVVAGLLRDGAGHHLGLEGEVGLGFGRIVLSETEPPHMFADMVCSG